MSSAAELFTQLEAIVAATPDELAAQSDSFSRLLAAVELTTEPILARVKGVQFLARHVAQFDAAMCRKAAQTAVKLLTEEQVVDSLAVGAAQLFLSLGKAPLDRKSDFFAREGADVMMQVTLDAKASEKVRSEATSVFWELAKVHPKAVLTKVARWISIDQEDGDATQQASERQHALQMLTAFVTTKEFESLWNEELQEHLLTLLGAVFPAVSKEEFQALVAAAAKLTVVTAGQGVPLLKAVLSELKLETLRGAEAVAALVRSVSRNASFNGLAEKVLAQKMASGLEFGSRLGSAQAIVLALSARLVDAATAEALATDLLGAVTAILATGGEEHIPENIQQLEALLFALSWAAGKQEDQQKLAALHSDELLASLQQTLTAITQLRARFVFLIKKRRLNGEATTTEMALQYTCLTNVFTVLTALVAKSLPKVGLTPSWISVLPLPNIKRERDATPAPAAAKKGPQGNGNNNSQRPAKKARTQK